MDRQLIIERLRVEGGEIDGHDLAWRCAIGVGEVLVVAVRPTGASRVVDGGTATLAHPVQRADACASEDQGRSEASDPHGPQGGVGSSRARDVLRGGPAARLVWPPTVQCYPRQGHR